MLKKLCLLFGFLLVFNQSMCLKLWIVSSKFRATEDSRENKAYQKAKSFVKARQWLEYRFIPEMSQVNLENPDTGEIAGYGLIKCYVPYGIGEVDANEHEFEYKITVGDGSAKITVSKIFSFIRDPNDIILNYGPKTERVATVTIRSCFRPLMDEFFEYIK
ncbi:DUF4468 domain-containing protein [Leptospira sp. 96542]|nr:DUF4468 domain-containing protein [Leptospira sp. 96542]